MSFFFVLLLSRINKENTCVLQSLLSRARDSGLGSSSRRVALFKNVETSGKSLTDTSRRLQTPLVNFNPFTPDSLLIQSATQQRNNRKRAHWNEYVAHFLLEIYLAAESHCFHYTFPTKLSWCIIT